MFICGFLFLLFANPAFAQVPQNVKAKGIRNMPYFEGTELKAFFNADAADPLPNGNIAATGFKMLSYGPGGTNDLRFVIQAPKCTFDYQNKRAWSDGPLQVYNATTNYFIRGEGFLCQQTSSNAVLDISNRVETVLQRENTNGSPAPPITIFSDHFHFTADSTNSATGDATEKRVATYTKNVRVKDPDFNLTSDILIVTIPPDTNKVRNVIALNNVTITSTADNSRATGDRGIYSSDGTNELVILTGSPFWRDSQNEGSAETFIFDRRNHIVLAQENARLKMPRKEMAGAGLLGPQTNAPAGTNQFIEITAQFLDIQLPATNAPSKGTNQQPRNLAARNNVVITSAADKIKATADDAFFDSGTGLLFLRTNAVWQTERMLAKAKFLTLDRSNQVFTAKQDAYLRVTESKPGATNRDLEIFSSNYELTTNLAQFRKNVRTELKNGNEVSRLNCNAMDAQIISNEVRTIVALQNVTLEQKSTNSQRTLNSEELTIRRAPTTGDIQNLFAKTNVQLLQAASGTNQASKLRANTVEMQFGKTNQLQRMIADGTAAEMENGPNSAKAEHVLYYLTSEGDRFELTGTPEATIERVQKDSREKIRIVNATWLRWDPKTGKFAARGPYQTVSVPPDQSSTNTPPAVTNNQPNAEPKK